MRVQEQMCGKVHVYTGVHMCKCTCMWQCACSGQHALVYVFLWRPEPIHLFCPLGTLTLDLCFEMGCLVGLELARLLSLDSQPALPGSLCLHLLRLQMHWELNLHPVFL